MITLVAAMLAVVAGASLPESWSPRTAAAFAAQSQPPSPREDPCDLIVGPAKAYCTRDNTGTASVEHDAAGETWRLVPAGAGLAALAVWRRRSRGAVDRRRR
ncbi:hypothetical protein [Streptomyces cyaneochromogenes]|uniref:hypothetical protein n=1 Tax=Streptomyces cyaneochromogenes TaxID=2496836 RepID=UPI001E525CDC|nr:hypothetical protein [Streptomyces cyaneochromogenes]